MNDGAVDEVAAPPPTVNWMLLGSYTTAARGREVFMVFSVSFVRRCFHCDWKTVLCGRY